MNRIARAAARTTVLAGTLLGVGCLSATEPPETLFWEGTFIAEANGPASLNGSAAMVALRSHSQLGVGIQGAPPSIEYGWVLRNGTCATPGNAVAPASAFPALDVNSNGDVDLEVAIERRLTGTDYAVQVIENADGSGEVLACADLTRT